VTWQAICGRPYQHLPLASWSAVRWRPATMIGALPVVDPGDAACSAAAPTDAVRQGLTLVHFPAQRKRFLWDRGCI